MAIGAGELHAGLSYLTIGRESTWGTGVTSTSGIDFISCGLKTTQETKILEQIETSRTYSKSIQLGKSIAGNVEFYLAPAITACAYFLENAFGGTVTSATATGETVGGGAFSHVFPVGDIQQQTYKGLSANVRKGDATNGKIFEYVGLRVNSMAFNFELDDALKCSVELVGKDSTSTTNDVSSNLTATAYQVLNFTDGRVSVENSFASLTSSSFWHVQSGSFSLNNNLASGSESRRIGSDVLQNLTPKMQTYELTLEMRFDTTTAYDAMLAQTDLSCELEFLSGVTISGSEFTEGLLLEFQKIRVKEAGDPEISGPDGILTSSVTFDVLRDESATGYAVQATLTNEAASI